MYIIARGERPKSPKSALLVSRTQRITKTIVSSKSDKERFNLDGVTSPTKHHTVAFKKLGADQIPKLQSLEPQRESSQKISKQESREPSIKYSRQESLGSKKSSLKKAGTFDLDGRPSKINLKYHDEAALSEDLLFKLFPGHKLLNILLSPNYFGEVALDESTTRYKIRESW